MGNDARTGRLRSGRRRNDVHNESFPNITTERVFMAYPKLRALAALLLGAMTSLGGGMAQAAANLLLVSMSSVLAMK